MALAPVPKLPVPLSVFKKPEARSSYLLTGPSGRHVALCWNPGEADELVKRGNAYLPLVGTLRALKDRVGAFNGQTACSPEFQAACELLRELGEA